MHWYLAVLKKYATFTGRARRREFWIFVLINVAVSYFLELYGELVGLPQLWWLFDLAVLVPTIAVAVRRLHDIGRSGWWILIALVPVVGQIAQLVFLATYGHRGDNRYGPDPRDQPETQRAARAKQPSEALRTRAHVSTSQIEHDEPAVSPRSMPPSFVFAAALLALYGLVVLTAVYKLPDVGSWSTGAAAVLLFAHAAAILMRQRVALRFGVAFFWLTALLYVCLTLLAMYLAKVLLNEAPDGAGRLGIGMLFVLCFISVPVWIALGLVSWRVAVALYRRRVELLGIDSARAWSVAIISALAPLALLAWTGYELKYRALAEQNACARGDANACRSLYFNRNLSVAERRGFMLRQCRRGDQFACLALLGATGQSERHAVTKAEADAAAATCRKGELTVCMTLARHLLAAMDVAAASDHLSFACQRSAHLCGDAATLLVMHDQGKLVRELFDIGCNAGFAKSCRGLLSQAGIPAEERKQLERRACSLGAAEVCESMIDQDFRGGCDYVCNLSSEASRCMHCVRKAAAFGNTEKAQAWKQLSCAHGVRIACEELEKPAGAAPTPAPAQASPTSLRDQQAIERRLAELMPAGCRSRVVDARYDGDRVTITGVADNTGCVSDAVRALSARGAQPYLLLVEAEDSGGRRFRIQLTASALGLK